MMISNISGSYQTVGRAASPGVKVSVDGLSKPITARVSKALSDEYTKQIIACARADAAKGSYMDGYDGSPRTGFSVMCDAQMKKYVSPDRARAISQVSSMLNNPNLELLPGGSIFDLLDLPDTATIHEGPIFGRTAQIYNENGEMTASYSSLGGWTSVPTADETRFQYESNQIYRAAYNAAKADIASEAEISPKAEISSKMEGVVTSGFSVQA